MERGTWDKGKGCDSFGRSAMVGDRDEISDRRSSILA